MAAQGLFNRHIWQRLGLQVFLLLTAFSAACLPVRAQGTPSLDGLLLRQGLLKDPSAAPKTLVVGPLLTAAMEDVRSRTLQEKREFGLCIGREAAGSDGTNHALIILQTTVGSSSSIDLECTGKENLAELHTHPDEEENGKIAMPFFSDGDLRSMADNSPLLNKASLVLSANDGSLLVALHTTKSTAVRERIGSNGAVDQGILSSFLADMLMNLAQPILLVKGQYNVPMDEQKQIIRVFYEYGTADYCKRLGLACYMRRPGDSLLHLLDVAAAESEVRTTQGIDLARATDILPVLGAAIVEKDPERSWVYPRRNLAIPLGGIAGLFDALSPLTSGGHAIPFGESQRFGYSNQITAFKYRSSGTLIIRPDFGGRLVRRNGKALSIEIGGRPLGQSASCIRFGSDLNLERKAVVGDLELFELISGSFDLICTVPGAPRLMHMRERYDHGVFAVTAVPAVEGVAPVQVDVTKICARTDPAPGCEHYAVRLLPLPHWDGTAWVWPLQPAKEGERLEAEVGARKQFIKDCGDCPEMAVIPAGTFQRGEPDSRHVVTFAKAFAMGRTEVTFAQWDACVAAGGCKQNPNDESWGRGDRPVINLSWDDAQEFVKWLSKKTRQKYRLPTEAESEYAARAGTGTAYAWGDEIGRNRANCDGCGSPWDSRQTAPVGSFVPNSFGLYDVHGNVWEWVEDCYHDSYAGAPSNGAAWTRACKDEARFVRGGSWGSPPISLRSAYRAWSTPGDRSSYRGFRVARDVK